LIIGPTPPPRHGVSTAIEALLSSEALQTYDVRHLELADRRGIQHVDKPDIHDVFLFVKQWLTLLLILFSERPRVVYIPVSQNTVGFIRDSFFMWPAYISGARIIFHLHAGNFRKWYESRNSLLRWYVTCVLRRLSRIIVLCDSLKTLFVGLIPSDRVSVVQNGIRWNSRPADPRIKDTRPHRRAVLHVGSLSRAKGTFVLLASIPMVLNRHRDIEFVVSGPWYNAEEREEAEKFIADHKLQEIVRFTGNVEGEEKLRVFQEADIFVFPGLQQEGQPLVAIEAMAASLPVIYTDRGCLKETIIDGENGINIPVNDPTSLAEKISWLMDNPREISRMGDNARKRYDKFYTLTRHVADICQVFDKALQEPR